MSLCRTCGEPVEPVPGTASMWRHVATGEVPCMSDGFVPLNKELHKSEFLIQKVDPRAGGSFKAHLDGDVGYDLEVWFPDADSFTLMPFTFVSLPTGIRVKVGDNAWGCIRPRSSTFIKRQLFVMEGTIDPGYTGDLFIIVFNPNPVAKAIHNGERLAQIIPVPKFNTINVHYVDEMPKTERGTRGFGSTGGHK